MITDCSMPCGAYRKAKKEIRSLKNSRRLLFMNYRDCLIKVLNDLKDAKVKDLSIDFGGKLIDYIENVLSYNKECCLDDPSILLHGKVYCAKCYNGEFYGK